MSKKSGDFARETHYQRFMKIFDNAVKSGVAILDESAGKTLANFSSSTNMIGLGILMPNPTRNCDKIPLYKMCEGMKRWIDQANGIGSINFTNEAMKTDAYIEALNEEMAKHCLDKYGLYCSVRYVNDAIEENRVKYEESFQLTVKMYPTDCHKLNYAQLKELNLTNLHK